ncbi:formin-like protein 5 [Nymphaea colorata]|nr:formin-like protein 5 [Nymphaea colorata]XP_031501295.1 formin-like protein 5 [Nymphaea colorata]
MGHGKEALILVFFLLLTSLGALGRHTVKELLTLINDRSLEESGEIGQDMVNQLWIACKQDPASIDASSGRPEFGEMNDSNLEDSNLEFSPSTVANVQKAINLLPPQMKDSLLDCLSRAKFLESVSGKDDRSSTWYIEQLEYLLGWHRKWRRYLADEMSFATIAHHHRHAHSHSHSPAPAPASVSSPAPTPFSGQAPASSPTPVTGPTQQFYSSSSNQFDSSSKPPISGTDIHGNANPDPPLSENNLDATRVIAVSVAVTAVSTFLFSGLLFCCYYKCCRSGTSSGSSRRDERPLLALSMSDFSVGSSPKSLIMDNSLVGGSHMGMNNEKFAAYSFSSNPSKLGQAGDLALSPALSWQGLQSVSLQNGAAFVQSEKSHLSFSRAETPSGMPEKSHLSLSRAETPSGVPPPPGRLLSNNQPSPTPTPSDSPASAAPPPPSSSPPPGSSPPPPPLPNGGKPGSAGPSPPPPPLPNGGKPGPAGPSPPPPPLPNGGKPGPAGPSPPPPPLPNGGKPGPQPPPPPKGAVPPRPPPPTMIPKTGRPSPLGRNKEGTSTSGNKSDATDESEAPKAKLKPFFWDKVMANPDNSMVWHQIKSGSFQFNEEMIETLFGCNSENKQKNNLKKENMRDASVQHYQLLEPKKSQNLSILLRALNVTTEEVCDALLEGNELSVELLQTLIKMEPTAEEEFKLRMYSGDLSQLGPAERFLKALVNIPFAFRRFDALLFMGILGEEVSTIKASFMTLEVACAELKSSRLFMKLLEAVLKTGNRMNDGTFRGGAQAFKLDTLLKLSDVKGTDGKTTLLHFVVQEIIRSEGVRAARAARESRSISSLNSEESLEEYPNESIEHFRSLGLQAVSGLGAELENVKKAAAFDADMLTSNVSTLANMLLKTKTFLNSEMKSVEESGHFVQILKCFVENAEDEITQLLTEEKKIMSLVKSTTDYFHGNSSKDEGLRLFVIVRDFLCMLDKVCKEVRENPRHVPQTPQTKGPSSVTARSPKHALFPAMDSRLDDSDDEDSSSR